MKELEFYQDGQTGTIIEKVCGENGGGNCCQELKRMEPNSTEGAKKAGLPAEKHLPVIERQGNTVVVKVGSVFHPMEDKHSIQWVALQSEKGCQRKTLSPDSEPVVKFALTEEDRPVAAYAYCNLHGLWKADV